MPIYQLEDVPEEFVTPKHSTAYGRLITGTQVEVGLLRYKAGEGAKQHAHPHDESTAHRLHRQFPAATLWHRDIHNGPSTGHSGSSPIYCDVDCRHD